MLSRFLRIRAIKRDNGYDLRRNQWHFHEGCSLLKADDIGARQ